MNGNTGAVIERLSRAFSSLNEAYNACNSKNWELFKEKYIAYLNNLREAVKMREDLAFLNSLIDESLVGKFITFPGLPEDIREWVEKNLAGSSDKWFLEIKERYVDAFALIVNDLFSKIRGLGGKTVSGLVPCHL